MSFPRLASFDGFAVARIPSPIIRFLHWWKSELGAIVPGWWRLHFQQQRPEVILHVAGDEGRVEARSLKQPPAPGSMLPLQEAVQQAVAMSREMGSEIEISLPEAAVYTRLVEVPSAAGHNLDQVLELDLERATPFRAGNCYVAHRVLDQVSGQGALHVRQFVLMRSSVNDLSARIGDAGGVVAWIGAGGPAAAGRDPVNFHTPEGKNWLGVRRVIAVAVIAMMISAPLLYVQRLTYALAAVRTEVEAARVDATSLQKVANKAQTTLVQRGALRKLTETHASALATIELASRFIPADAYLTDLRIKAGNVEMSGLARMAAQLPQILERSGAFVDVVLTSPIVPEQDGRERFSLKARVAPHAAAQPSRSP